MDLVNAVDLPIIYPEFYIVPTNAASILLFFTSGDASQALNRQSDISIIQNLTKTINTFSNWSGIGINNYIITRWEQDVYSLGSYSYYQTNTTPAAF